MRFTAAGAVATAAGVLAAGFGLAAVAWGTGSASSQNGGTGWGWYKTDTHVHSVFSGDGNPDLGIIQASGLKSGYDAFFLTDHHLGSSFPISVQTGNNLTLDDNPARWSSMNGGSLQSSASPLKTGTVAWRLASGEAYWTKRAANFRSGAVRLSFSVTKPLASGFYVSASLGGDPSLPPVSGYTTESGQVLERSGWVFVWYLGSAPPPPMQGAQVINIPLAGSCSSDATWTNCTVADMRAALQQIPAAQRPLDYNAFTDVKVGAYGGAAGNLDAFAITAQAPVAAEQEFAHRNSFLSNERGVLGRWDTQDFRIYPGVENGIGDHVNRFDFGRDEVPSFRPYQNGIQGIAAVRAGGYLSQLDHTGLPGGVSDQEARSGVSDKPPTKTEGSFQGVPGFGAEVMELNTDNMLANWDAILSAGAVVLGTRSTDNHLGTWSAGSEATYIQAPSVEFDDLMRSMYEGRMFMALNSWGDNRVIFNPDPASADAHPARYPIFVPQSQTTASAHLTITGGIAAGSNVVWITNGGQVLASDPAPGPAYDAVRSVPLTGSPFTYVRAELRRSGSGLQEVITEPLIFRKVAELPAGMSFHVDGVTTPNGAGYATGGVEGITAGAWDVSVRALTVAMQNPAGSLVEFQTATGGQAPVRVTAGGSPVPRAGLLADYLAAEGPSWLLDAGIVHVKARQGAGPTSAVVAFAGTAGDIAPPSAPGGLAAEVAGPTRIELSWSASADDVGVAGYDVYRDGVAIAQLPPGATSYSDTGVAHGATYRYAVDAFDAAGNHSPQSNVVTARTDAGSNPGPTTPSGTTPTPGSTTTSPPVGRGPTVNRGSLDDAQITRLVTGAFRAAASEAHEERFILRASVRVGKVAASAARRLPRPIAVRASGEAIVERASRVATTATLSSLRGRVTLVAFDGRLFVSGDGRRFRRALPALARLLPPALPSGLGGSPSTLPSQLTRVRDLGLTTVGGIDTRRLRAQMKPAAMRRFLVASLVRGGMSGAAARSTVARGRVRVNRVDLHVLEDGRLDRQTVNVTISVSARPRATTPGAMVSATLDVALNRFGADLTVARPRSGGVVASLRALVRR
jgi:hypothetical protein